MTLPAAYQLGQYIPLHYHFNMLADDARMGGFRDAIAAVVPLGGRVLELGSGTGVQSFFAAQRASRVTAVEKNPALVEASRRFLAANGVADRVTVVQGDASAFVPEEPVDVVICEMLHSALLREKQVEVIGRFSESYWLRFHALPRFIPEVTLLAAQPVWQEYTFHGYHAPVPFFQHPAPVVPGCTPLAEPVVYAQIDYAQQLPQRVDLALRFEIAQGGTVNALRFITKNLLAILPDEQRSIDWHNQYLVMPLSEALTVQPGQTLEVRFAYDMGAELEQLGGSLRAQVF